MRRRVPLRLRPAPNARPPETGRVVDVPLTDRAHVHDLHATILHLLGLDHLKLTFKFQGRNFRLTDVAGDVIHKLIV